MMTNFQLLPALISKYDVPGPRYTSYPTVPFWDEATYSSAIWQNTLQGLSFDGLSLYIHLPFCERLCTYCGCHTRITKNHEVEAPYIDALLQEWELYKQLLKTTPQIKELHLGGGTPTFFSAENLTRLVDGLFDGLDRKDVVMSFEAHPGVTSVEQLKDLFEVGFRRVSFGIQDFDMEVQQIINRRQTFDQVKYVTDAARMLGYTSINFDLIYGLPKQSLDTIARTMERTLLLKPDRIAYYSYAHVPWLKPAQKSFEKLLPATNLKSQMYEHGKQILREAGYLEIGMDHFALPNDELTIAYQEGRLHRNFMGYTAVRTNRLIGLGVSSISDVWSMFSQNVKELDTYYRQLKLGQLPLLKGHQLSEEDLLIREHILDLMCQGSTFISESAEIFTLDSLNSITEMIKDELIIWENNTLSITPTGKPFLRNVCMAFDKRLWTEKEKKARFSKTM